MNSPIIISHRGNIDGPNPETENLNNTIRKALELGFYIECDVWWDTGAFFLGHSWEDKMRNDETLDCDWFSDPRFFFHCKTATTLSELSYHKGNCFYQDDEITSRVLNTAFELRINHSSNKHISENVIIVFLGPYEDFNKEYDISKVKPYGIITDYPQSFKEGLKC